MFSAEPNQGWPRLSFRWRLLTILSVAPFMYLLWRWAYCPAVLTASQHTFLILYVLLFSCIWTLAMYHGHRFISHLPPMLRSFWPRFAIYMVLGVGLSTAVHALPLPAFYTRLLGNTCILLLVPFVITGKRAARTTSENRDLLDAHVVDPGGEIILQKSSGKGAIALLTCCAFAITGVFCLQLNSIAGWICVVFFGLGCVLGVIMLIPGSICLILKPDGFTMVNLWRRTSLRWSDMDDLSVVTGFQGPCVGWNMTQPHLRPKSFQMVRDTYGKDAVLLQDYGISPEELCSLMRQRKAAAAT